VDDKTLNALIGRRLRSRRRALDLTQDDVGRLCGVSPQQVQKYEAGAPVSATRLFALAEALEVSVGSFFEGVARAPADIANSSDRRIAGPKIKIGG
jgi:transcriptional regulator with XRE-family HTH domain